MFFLISNDDGVFSEGLCKLVKVVEEFGNYVVVAPDRERSATSHAISISTASLELQKVQDNIYAFAGTPADCVMLAFHYEGFLAQKPSWVISGINRGGNVGTDVIYSGTVAAAIEGAINGCRGMAVSLDGVDGAEEVRFDVAAEIVRVLLKNESLLNIKEGHVLNVNVPNIPLSEIKGIKLSTVGKRNYINPVTKISDGSNGLMYFKIGGGKRTHESIEGTDCELIKQGYVTLSVLSPSLMDVEANRRLDDQTIHMCFLQHVKDLSLD